MMCLGQIGRYEMSDKPENPPAYTEAGPLHGLPIPGMTLRDYLAGQVDVSVYNPITAFKNSKGHGPNIPKLAEYVAKIRMIEADAMLKEGDND